jgi:hypothetical protein
MPRSNLMAELMAETINYGGIAATREQVYDHALRCARSRLTGEPDAERRAMLAADQFAFGRQAVALAPDDVARRIPWETAVAAGLL